LELDVQSGKLEQMNKLDSLEDNILFVGDRGDSISLSASAFSKLETVSIYFVEDSGKDDFELRIYNVQDGSFHGQSLLLSFRPINGGAIWGLGLAMASTLFLGNYYYTLNVI